MSTRQYKIDWINAIGNEVTTIHTTTDLISAINEAMHDAVVITDSHIVHISKIIIDANGCPVTMQPVLP